MSFIILDIYAKIPYIYLSLIKKDRKMTPKEKRLRIKQIKNVLSSQRFYDFYQDGGEYDNYIANRADEKKEKAINEKILELFSEVLK